MGYLDYSGLQYLWGKLKEKFAAKSHTHTKSQISDFPTSMPASDVKAWAKADTKPSYAWSEITGKPSTFAPSSHNHDDRYYTETEINDKLALKVHEETITTAVDLDTMKTTGIYHLKVTGCTNHPYNGNHSTLYVEWSIGTPYQLVMIDSQNRAWRRNYNNSTSTFGSWTELKLTDTWRGIQNNLTSDSTTDSLSAAQGKALKTLVDGKAASNHSHDLSAMINTLSTGTTTPVDADYYVSQYVGGGTTTTTYHRRPMSALWAYIKGKADSVYLKLSGGTITGALHLKQSGTGSYNENIRMHPSSNNWSSIVMCGDDNTGDSGTSTKTWGIFTYNGQFGIAKNGSGLNGNTATPSFNCTDGTWRANGSALITSANIGSQSVSSATTATKLSTSAGSATRPVYFSDGKPVAGTYTLGNASSKTIRTLSSQGPSGWKDSSTDGGYVPDMAFMAYWNGAYNTSGSSNLAYCNKGAFGTAATKNTGDFATAGHTHDDRYYTESEVDAKLTKKADTHSHPYLPLAGGTMTGDITFTSIGDTATSKKITWSGSTDGADIYYQTTAADQGNLVINLRDDSNCYLRIAYNGAFKSYFSPSDGNFHGNVNGTASAANSVNSFTFKTQTSDPGANSSLTTGQILLVYE